MSSAKVLLVEDDELASELVYSYLVENGFEVRPVFTATDSISHVKHDSFDIVILDINLPDFNGFEVLKSIRRHVPLPVIVTSAYSDLNSKLMAFKYGAGDYMVKPLELKELEARIWAQLSRNSTLGMEKEERIFELRGSSFFFRSAYLDLTAVEFEILLYLFQKKNQIVGREELLENISTFASNRSLDNHIKNIRKKIGDMGGKPQYLKTIYARGYMLTV